MNPAFDAMSFWGTVVCLLLMLLSGCLAELVMVISERRKDRSRESCKDAVAEQDECSGVLR